MDISRADAALIASRGRATSMSFILYDVFIPPEWMYMYNPIKHTQRFIILLESRNRAKVE